MGNLCFKKKKLLIYSLYENPGTLLDEIVGFSANVFQDTEWASLKEFCEKRNISQSNLNLAFKKHCTYLNAHILDYRVRLVDLKMHFVSSSRLQTVCYIFFFISYFTKETSMTQSVLYINHINQC